MITSNYLDFIKSKRHNVIATGITIERNAINNKLFEFQKDVVSWATYKGKAAIFLDTGMGKTFIQLEWARLMGKRTLIIAPLSVARQTVREGKKIDIAVKYIRHNDEIDDSCSIFITNYEMVDNISISQFQAVVLDESSILKAMGSKTRKRLTELCKDIPYRLACTATPAPNDNIEIGNHAEFLGICTQAEMLAMFFINANKEHTYIIGNKSYRRKGTNKAGTEWRIKHHAEHPFFECLSIPQKTIYHPGYNLISRNGELSIVSEEQIHHRRNLDQMVLSL